MNIIVINQPINNHGDEAAHKALLRSLAYKFPCHLFTVMFFHVSQESVDAMNVHLDNVKYVNVTDGFSKKKYEIIKIAFRNHCGKMLKLLPQFRAVEHYLKSADCIINAPGGICMGTFHNWEHVYFLKLAQWLNKPVAYYSRSFGPFTITNTTDKLFNKLCIDLLRKFSFLSIRDSKSMSLAESLGINYEAAIDTAFLNVKRTPLPNVLVDKKYCVLVPNSLVWHPTFKKCSEKYIKLFYQKLTTNILKRYPDLFLVFLPQLFNKEDGGDKAYFKILNSALTTEEQKRIIIVDDKDNSDVQQTIISKSEFIIGARYHSIVFAINNEVQFVSLSYEHKMEGLLSILDLESRSVPFNQWVKNESDIDASINHVILKLGNSVDLSQAHAKALNIANNCERKLVTALKL